MSDDDARKGDKKQKPKEPTTLGRRSTDGAWLTYSRTIAYEPTTAEAEAGGAERVYVTSIHGVYPDVTSANDAIIELLELGDGSGTNYRRVFVPWGATLDEVLSASGS